LEAPLPDVERSLVESEEKAAIALRESKAAPVALPVGESALPLQQREARPADLFLQSLEAGFPARSPVAQPASKGDIDFENARLGPYELPIQLALAIARADGRVARKEREILDNYLRERCGADPALLNRVRALAAHYETAAINLEECLTLIRQRHSPGER